MDVTTDVPTEHDTQEAPQVIPDSPKADIPNHEPVQVNVTPDVPTIDTQEAQPVITASPKTDIPQHEPVQVNVTPDVPTIDTQKSPQVIPATQQATPASLKADTLKHEPVQLDVTPNVPTLDTQEAPQAVSESPKNAPGHAQPRKVPGNMTIRSESPSYDTAEIPAPEITNTRAEIPAPDTETHTTPEYTGEDYGIPASDTLNEKAESTYTAPGREKPEPTDTRKSSETPAKVRAEFPVATDTDILMAAFSQVQPTQIIQPSQTTQDTQTGQPDSLSAPQRSTEAPGRSFVFTAPEAPEITQEAPEIMSAEIPQAPEPITLGAVPEPARQATPETVSEAIPEALTEAADTPKISRPSRTQSQTQRTPHAVREAQPEITQETGNDSQPAVSRTQNHPGHEEITETESRQSRQNQSRDSQTDGTISPERVRVSSARTSRATERNESRNEPRLDSRKAEALSDFQSFFDTATRAKRTASHVNTRPLSLITDTYEAPGVQSQGRTLRNGIVNTVRFIRAEGVRKANIIVDPPALGRITVELTSGTSGVEASVKVASEQIRQIVQEQFTQLRDNLAQQGVQVSEFTVDVQQDNTGHGQDSGGQNQRDSYSYTASEDDSDTETFRADLEEGLLYWVA